MNINLRVVIFLFAAIKSIFSLAADMGDNYFEILPDELV